MGEKPSRRVVAAGVALFVLAAMVLMHHAGPDADTLRSYGFNGGNSNNGDGLAAQLLVSPRKIKGGLTKKTFEKNPTARKAHVHKCAHAAFDMFVHDPALCKFISKNLLAGGWECHIINDLARNMKPGEAFMDIGSNVGAFSLTLGHLGYTVYAFEAMDFNVELQRASIGTFPMKGKVNLFQMAISEKTGGELCISAAPDAHPDVNQGNGQIHPGPCGAGDEVIPSVAIDDVLDSFPEDDCFYAVKADIEGYETFAFRGASRMFAGKCPPCLVYMEYNHIYEDYLQNLGLEERAAFKFLEANGYECEALARTDYKCTNRKPEQKHRCGA